MTGSTKRRLTMSLKYSVVNKNAEVDIMEKSASQMNIEIRRDRIRGNEGGLGASIILPTSNPTRNIERYPDVS